MIHQQPFFINVAVTVGSKFPLAGSRSPLDLDPLPLNGSIQIVLASVQVYLGALPLLTHRRLAVSAQGDYPTRALGFALAGCFPVKVQEGFSTRGAAIPFAIALMAAGILALQDAELAARLDKWRADLSASIPDEPSDD